MNSIGAGTQHQSSEMPQTRGLLVFVTIFARNARYFDEVQHAAIKTMLATFVFDARL